MPASTIIDPAIIRQYFSESHSLESVNEKLLAQGWDEESVTQSVTAYKKARMARRQTSGVIYLVAGAVSGFISCVLAMIDPVPQLHDLFLFGITSIAILLICYGLYYFFE